MCVCVKRDFRVISNSSDWSYCFTGGGFQNILVIGADALSRNVDWTDRGTCILFGDAAGAVLVQVNFTLLPFERNLNHHVQLVTLWHFLVLNRMDVTALNVQHCAITFHTIEVWIWPITEPALCFLLDMEWLLMILVRLTNLKHV